tara:strand:+ start:75 stop:320 length:246 start_codon:yes stop_codon:yes gene_type:complete
VALDCLLLPIAGAFTPSRLGPTNTPTIAKSANETTPANIAVGAGVPIKEAKTRSEVIQIPNYKDYKNTSKRGGKLFRSFPL